MVKVKICGITNLEDALMAQEAGADILGFIFAQSPRRIAPDTAKKIISKLPKKIKIAALFVNEKKDTVDNVLREIDRADFLQFHGNETPKYCKRFSGTRIKIIKVFRIKDETSLAAISDFKKYIDLALLDTFKEGDYGGTGRVFDWALALKAKEYGIPIILSGGLNPSNIKDAILKVRPYCVDVSSGVEKYAAKKDQKLITSFVDIAKSI